MENPFYQKVSSSTPSQKQHLDFRKLISPVKLSLTIIKAIDLTINSSTSLEDELKNLSLFQLPYTFHPHGSNLNHRQPEGDYNTKISSTSFSDTDSGSIQKQSSQTHKKINKSTIPFTPVSIQGHHETVVDNNPKAHNKLIDVPLIPIFFTPCISEAFLAYSSDQSIPPPPQRDTSAVVSNTIITPSDGSVGQSHLLSVLPPSPMPRRHRKSLFNPSPTDPLNPIQFASAYVPSASPSVKHHLLFPP